MKKRQRFALFMLIIFVFSLTMIVRELWQGIGEEDEFEELRTQVE